jgi:hypothetical protein
MLEQESPLAQMEECVSAFVHETQVILTKIGLVAIDMMYDHSCGNIAE